MKTGDGYTGMPIDLWNALAKERNIEAELVEFDTTRELVSAMREGEVDAGITAVTLTEARAEFIEFAHPWFDGGLQIMVSDEPRTSLERDWGPRRYRAFAGVRLDRRDHPWCNTSARVV